PFPQIHTVETQVTYSGTTCCPDMILHLSPRYTIACEHKLDAVETLGPESNPIGQLERYLELPIDGLVYFGTCGKPPSEAVLSSPKYIRPANREHFLWRDLYPLLAASNNTFLGWMKEGFERLGFTPPHPSVGEMSRPDDETNRENRRNFAKLWGPTRSLAHSLGWKVKADSIVELYPTDNTRSAASWIFISPAKADRFLVRVTPQAGNLQLILNRMAAVASGLDERIEVVQHSVRRKGGAVTVVDVITTLADVLGPGSLSVTVMEERLCSFVGPLLEALQA
ncbi:MAG: hypothetical protein NTV92_00015, partial [Candidatus Bipolaricaulota bacterium]|nr:hypothetical protein [Candidatus Bipolaricaulota bacterium]